MTALKGLSWERNESIKGFASFTKLFKKAFLDQRMKGAGTLNNYSIYIFHLVLFIRKPH